MKRKNLGGAKRQHGEERTVAAAAGAFLVICGVLLVFGGFAQCDQAAAAGEQQVEDTRKEDAARDALRHAEAAEKAFTTENYGDARRHIRAIRQRLADSLHGSEARNE